jgi:transcriptional regulator with XRE-family HTH domain
MQDELQEDRSRAVALTVREELARRRLSRQWLADRARISLSTLEKALSGRRPFTLATVVRIEEALETSLRAPAGNGGAPAAASSGFAPEEMGAYARPAVRWLEGEYLTLRPSFKEAGALYSYRTMIEWDDSKSHLSFSETDRVDRDFEQQGFVSFPHLSGQIYLVTSCAGQFRVAILSRPMAGGALSGVLTTLVSGQGAQLIPAATPLTLIPARAGTEPQYGLLHAGDRCWSEYRECVDRITKQGYVLFPGVGPL